MTGFLVAVLLGPAPLHAQDPAEESVEEPARSRVQQLLDEARETAAVQPREHLMAVWNLFATGDLDAVLTAIGYVPVDQRSGPLGDTLTKYEAVAYERAGRFAEVIETVDRYLARTERDEPARLEERSIQELQFIRARVFLGCGDPERAARSLSALTGDLAKTMRIGIALAQEDFASARRLCADLLDTETATNDPDYRARIELQQLQARQRLESGDRVLGELLALAAREALQPDTRRRIHVELAAAYLDRSDLAAAAAALEVAESALSPAQRAGRHTLVGHTSVFARLALLAEGSETGKRFDLASARRMLGECWEDLLRRWSSLGLRDGGTQFLQYGQRRDVLALAIRLAVRDAASLQSSGREALRPWLQAEQQDSLVRVLQLDELDGSSALGLVPEDGGLLLYAPAPAGSVAIACDREGVEVFELASDTEIGKALAPLENTVADPTIPTASVRRHAAAARDALIPAALARRMSAWKSVWIVGSELLRSPPFEALVDGDGWLGSSRKLARLPTLTVAHWIRGKQRRSHPAEGFLGAVLADRPAEDLRDQHAIRPLQGSEDFWDSPFRPFTREATESLRGEAAQRDAIQSLAARSSLMLFVAHGIFDPTLPRPRGLALADRGLFAADLESLELPGLVTYLSCQAADVPRRGESVAPHIGGASIRAGASAVLLSEHPVWLDSGMALAERLHARLLDEDGPDVAEALRRARSELAATEAFGHPAHHASLHLVGWPAFRPALPAQTARGTTGWWLAAAAVAGSLALALMLRRRAR